MIVRLLQMVRLENVFTIHEQTAQLGRKRIDEKIAKFVQQNTSSLLEDEQFEHCQRTSLELILSQPQLDVIELDLFDACVRWARAVCARNNVADPTPKRLRETLGDLIYLLRLSSFTYKDFIDRPLSSGLFADREALAIICHLSSDAKSKPKGETLARFDLRSRCFSRIRWIEIKVCTDVALSERALVSTFVESIHFESSQDFYFIGFALHGSEHADCSHLTLQTRAAQQLFFAREVAFVEKRGFISNFILPQPVRVRANEKYELSMVVRMSAPTSLTRFQATPCKVSCKNRRGNSSFEIIIAHHQSHHQQVYIRYIHIH